MPLPRARTFFWAVLALAPALPGGLRAAPRDELDRDIDRTIDGAVGYLLKAVEGPAGWSPEEKFPAGYAALQVYALIKSDVSFQHPLVQKGLSVMEGYKFEKVYSVSLYLMAYDAMVEQIDAEARLGGTRAAPERARFVERMGEALNWLLSARLPGAGAWNYEPSSLKADPRNRRYDHSNTQFAVLALGVAAERKLKVPSDVWDEIADHFIATQEKEGEEVSARPTFRRQEAGAEKGEPGTAGRGKAEDRGGAGTGKTVARKADPLYQGEGLVVKARGWRYSMEDFDPPKFSMTCAGLSSLLLAERNLSPAARAGSRGQAVRRALRDGYGWATRFLNSGPRPLGRLYNLPYDLYSLEKVGDLGEVAAFGEFRWYEEGARLLSRSQLGDGSWGPRDDPAIVRHNTALALLFLDRATDLGARSRPLARITMVGKGAEAGGEPPDRSYWLYLPSQKAEVPLPRLFRLFRYRPSPKVVKMVEEAVKVHDPERLHELVEPLAAAVEQSPFPGVEGQARKLLGALTGVERQEVKWYREWAERWAEVLRIGKAGQAEEVEGLRERLRTSEGTPLKAKVIWALSRCGGRAALGDLIDLLEAPDPALREAAYSALTFLSGQSLPFPPRGPEKARAESVRAWREWHEREKARGAR